MPVACLRCSKRPFQCLPAEAGLNMCIVGHEDVVVVIDKGIIADQVVQRYGSNNKEETESPSLFLDRLQEACAGPELSRHLRCQADRSHACSCYLAGIVFSNRRMSLPVLLALVIALLV